MPSSFKKELLNDKEITKILSKKEISECFEVKAYLKNIDITIRLTEK